MENASIDDIEFIEIQDDITNEINGNIDIDHELQFKEVDEKADAFEEFQQPENFENAENNEINNRERKKNNFLKKLLKSRIVTRRTNVSRKEEPTLSKTEEIRSTFTLDIDDEGNLVGLNIGKQKIKSQQERFIKIKKFVSKFSKSKKTEDKSGLVGKIKSIFSKIKLKKTNEEEASKISNILKRIKGIFSKS